MLSQVLYNGRYEVSYMEGMTDKQFVAYIRILKKLLDKAIEEKNWDLVKEISDELQQSIES